MSRIDDIVTAIDTRMDDSTVEHVAGKLKINEHAQQRRIIYQRTSGSLGFSAAPGRKSAVVSGSGTKQVFTREETLLITLSAENEANLDVLFDRFINAVFEEFGPNAFEDENPYSWHGDDSAAAGQWLSRNPRITLTLTVRLRSQSDSFSYGTATTAQTEVTELGSSVTVNNS